MSKGGKSNMETTVEQTETIDMAKGKKPSRKTPPSKTPSKKSTMGTSEPRVAKLRKPPPLKRRKR